VDPFVVEFLLQEYPEAAALRYGRGALPLHWHLVNDNADPDVVNQLLLHCE
jgi:hypothetical protein